MKRVKYLFAAIILFSAALCSALFCGCDSDDGTRGEIYTLQQSFDNGYLSYEDLESIAYYINNDLSDSRQLDSGIAESIKESAAKRMREDDIEPIPDAKAEGFTIISYYGCYSDCHVVRLRDEYVLRPTNLPDYWKEIGGVNFHITTYDTVGVYRAN